ncbi:hypothetical protein DW352_15885 [Pseudolabrys taiwanensis]|uniref:Uncharacterized protein n=1 Tax=Pseudolabrys taiwanensis TaxID=331696 RepID=A0A345ZY77_9HYPH|nr:hypothetical protein DW352_15885 [Pseudolabrys taiwanensis]
MIWRHRLINRGSTGIGIGEPLRGAARNSSTINADTRRSRCDRGGPESLLNVETISSRSRGLISITSQSNAQPSIGCR